jgi:hypothetical protein
MIDRIKQRILYTWYKILYRVARSVIQDELTEALHPDFGWVWREEEQDGKFISSAYEQGYKAAQRDFCNNGISGWIDKCPEENSSV